ncbi:hypothetical protein SKAU_G00101330 [Synaphobranchus kaupii]|uniref:Uncharacterized protein n=1 Tax=Synaphobranchus kaupii TaxID=118154 RepID=A0A9Q1FZI1_SYNKA|nr:hypothetical protein SKAU_G00101330 [Synaphobranchus kaupii]
MLLLLSGHLCLFFMEFVVGGPLGPRITLRPPTGNYSCVYVTTGPIGNHTISRSDVVIVNVTVKFESIWVLIVAGSAGGAVFLLLILLCVCLTYKSRTHTKVGKSRPTLVTFSTYHRRPVQGEDLDLEPDYEDMSSEGSGSGYINVEIPDVWKGCNDGDTPSEDGNASYINVEIPEEKESVYGEEDYVNTETMEMYNAPVCDIDSDSEPDYENCGTAK